MNRRRTSLGQIRPETHVPPEIHTRLKRTSSAAKWIEAHDWAQAKFTRKGYKHRKPRQKLAPMVS